MAESTVVLVYKNLCDYGCNLFFDSPLCKLVADCILKVIADIALAHCTALGERHIRLDCLSLCCSCHTQIDHTNLRSVAVCYNNFVSLLDQIDNGLSRLTDKFKLFIRGVSKGVSA